MVFVDRDPEREVRHLEWRIRLFGAGAILALVGMWADAKWLVWLALAVLIAGFGLRFLPEGGRREEGAGREAPTEEGPAQEEPARRERAQEEGDAAGDGAG